jgi:hypothetical protein
MILFIKIQKIESPSIYEFSYNQEVLKDLFIFRSLILLSQYDGRALQLRVVTC